MSIRRSLALNVAPLALRLALGATFIWAGVSKIAHTTTVTDPQHLALLVEWDQIDGVTTVMPDADPDLGDQEPDPMQIPDLDIPEEDDIPVDDATDPIVDDEPALDTPPPADPAPVQDDETGDPETDETQLPADDAGDDDAGSDDTVTDDEGDEEGEEEVGQSQPELDPGVMPVSYVQATESAEVKRVLGLALMIHDAANPGVSDEGQPLMPLWPAGLANGSLPVVIAWVASILELVCGAALLTGFFTRMASLPLIGTMLTAMWLTQIGPAIQSGDAVLGFLPQGVFDYGAGGPVYAALLWQFALAAIGFAMLLIGPGCFSIDRLIFGASTSAREEEARQVEFVPMGD